MKILVVEDEDDVRRALLRLLEDNGHEVVTVSGKDRALGYLRRWQADLVITDLNMDKVDDGLDLILEADARHSSIKFWLVSAGMTDKVVAKAKDLGAERIIPKSMLLQVLKEDGIIT